MKRWLIRFLNRLETGTVHCIRKEMKEEFCATVHNGQLYLTKGTKLFFCGDCEHVITKCFEHEQLQPITQPREDA